MRPRAIPDAHMHAALEVNLPNYASAIVTADEIVGTLFFFPAQASLTTSPFLRLKCDQLPFLGLVNQPIVRAGVDLHHRTSARSPVGEKLWIHGPMVAISRYTFPQQLANPRL